MDERLEHLKTAMFTLVEKNAKSGIDDMKFDQEYEKIFAEHNKYLRLKMSIRSRKPSMIHTVAE